MKFRTEFRPERSDVLTLDPARPVALIGSCFAENIARKMIECKWHVFNGVGTLYNPVSIARIIELLVLDGGSTHEIEDSLFESCGHIHSWLFDTHFSRAGKSECVEAIVEAGKNFSAVLSEAQALIVTFGTSWCYYLEERTDYVVANCHKMPQALFSRRRIPVDDIAGLWTRLCSRLKSEYPELKIIFTVSPVRHLKDGFEGNSRSKAALLLAVEKICRIVPDAFYFPAYEIVCDDLRDYRFYAADLVHPSDMAVEYIWEIFQSTYINEAGRQKLKEGNRRYKAENHRPIAQK